VCSDAVFAHFNRKIELLPCRLNISFYTFQNIYSFRFFVYIDGKEPLLTYFPLLLTL